MYNSPGSVAGQASGGIAYTGTGSVLLALTTAIVIFALGGLLTIVAKVRRSHTDDKYR